MVKVASTRLCMFATALAILWAVAAGSDIQETASANATSCTNGKGHGNTECRGDMALANTTSCANGKGNGDTGCRNESLSSQGRGSPRGDDDRPRSWGKENEHGETEFDDRKSPRTVAFMGRSANLRIYPNYSDPSVFLQLRFGKVEELDAAGRPVPRHAVPSLADPGSLNFFSGNLTLNGVNMSYVNVTINPTSRQSFSTSCQAPASGGDDDSASTEATGSGRRLLKARSMLAASDTVAPQLNISLLFGLDDALTLPYGDVNITVPRNGLKWTVSYKNWPFCNDSNVLAVSMSLVLANNASAQVTSESSGAQRLLRIALGSSYNATLGFIDYALTAAVGQQQERRMPVNVSLATHNASEGAGAAMVRVLLPNPKPYNATAAVYDPTQTTTSAYLTADDPGNANAGTVSVATTQSGGSNAAGIVRTTVWAAVGTALLGMFLNGDVRHWLL